MEVYLTKINGVFIPTHDSDYEKVKAIPNKSEVKVKITIPRNSGYHKKFFAMLRLVIDNMPDKFAIYRNEDLLLDELKMQTGHVELRESLGGKAYFRPASISFANMDQKEFETFFHNCLDVVIKYFLPNMKEEEILQELINFY